MSNRIILVIIIAISMASCSVLRQRSGSDNLNFASFPELKKYCDTVSAYQSIFINRVDAVFEMEGESYNAMLSLYYIPDSVFFITASNSGFEIIRAMMNSDSLMVVNRLDKLVYLHYFEDGILKDPFNFEDVEYLLNRAMICGDLDKAQLSENRIFFNRSVPDIRKAVYFDINMLSIVRFEFYQKLTHEYIVGEKNSDGALEIFSNYIIEDVRIIAKEGNVQIDKRVDVDMKYNRRKYITIEI